MTSIYHAVLKGTQEQILAVLSRTASSDSTGLDITQYEGTIAIMLAASAATAGTNPTLDCKVAHSDVLGSGYTDVSGGAFAQVTTTAGHQVLKLSASKLKKYIRVSWVIGGTVSPAFTFGASLFGIKKQH